MTRTLLDIILNLTLILLLVAGRGMPCSDGCMAGNSGLCRQHEARDIGHHHDHGDDSSPSATSSSEFPCLCQPPGLLAHASPIFVPVSVELFPARSDLVPPSVHHSPPDPVPLA